ncbi:MAG: ATP-dependent RNA helicase RhlB, partial [Pseudomonadales bacterium]|nr:ATP-dependent RNA helicase RhlB [Pseudomonadales bacterium]
MEDPQNPPAPDAEIPSVPERDPSRVPLRTTVRFHDFDLPVELLRATDELGFEFCTPIQAQS